MLHTIGNEGQTHFQIMMKQDLASELEHNAQLSALFFHSYDSRRAVARILKP